MDTHEVTEADLAWMAALPPEWSEGVADHSTTDEPDAVLEAAGAVANALAAEQAVRGGGGGLPAPAPPMRAPLASPADSDAAWLAANPDRQLRARERRPEDRVPYWAEWSAAGCFAVVRRPLYGQAAPALSDVTLIALEAVGGAMPADTDADARAALRAGSAWVVAAQ